MSITYNLINEYFPAELKAVNKPWQYLQSSQGQLEFDHIMNDFIDTVNEELSKQGEQVRLYRLEDITPDVLTFQPRAEMSQETILRYHNAYENNVDMPPVHVATIKEYPKELTRSDKLWNELYPEYSISATQPKLYLLDGYHRYKAIEKLPPWQRYIAAIDHGEMTMNEAKYFSVRQNIANGLSFNKADMLKVFRIYVDTEQYKLCSGNVKSYKTIAKELSLMSRPTIKKYMQDLYPDVDKEIRRQHPCQRPKNEEKDDVNMKRSNTKAVGRFDNKLAEIKKLTELMSTECDIEHCEEQALAFVIALRKKRGADASSLSAMLNDYRDY